ncbi:ENTH domain-containing protein c [Cryptococcus deuterogattii R265]|uniref:ENTH domain-containing protein c n=1 Tax=Cryptococcus deuterogattii (strain R265) TaxID=294750 RepID=UPI0019364A48|nr:ENTH domain-containing protein c [Cryptococcus deuterogattii R265]
MDLIENLAKQASQLTMYDVKSYYTQAKNAVLNISEMEAKVREATNDDPWGASSTLMQQIAEGTHNFAQFNEIMPTIYSRFMEKEAREWRQIYKALTLLEFLVKNGSERVVDDARAHISTIKMLRSFHYIDEKGKDQGINVRNRASEIALLLGDVEKIRTERRKARANRNKYQGAGNDGGMSFITSTGSRYGGFGSDSVGSGSSAGRYGGGDDFRSSSRGFRDTSSSQSQFDEYEGADDFDEQPPRRTTSISRSVAQAPPKPVAKEKEVEKPKEVNLFDFDDEPLATPAAAPAVTASAAPAVGGDDDFDDFQSAEPAPAPAPQAPAPAPAGRPANANVFDLLNSTTSAPTTAPSISTPAFPPSASNSSGPTFGYGAMPQPFNAAPSIPSSNVAKPPAPSSRPSYTSSSTPSALSPKPTGGSSNSTFDDLFASSLSSIGKSSTTQSKNQGGKTIKDLEKEKMVNSLWGSTPSAPSQSTQAAQPAQPQASRNFDDLLL